MNKKQYPTSTPHDVVCLWHANCMDGQIAAAIVHRYFEGKVECLAVRYNEEPPLELIKGKHVYLVDFSYPPEVLMPHRHVFNSLHILDHHQDAMKPWLKLEEEGVLLGKVAVYFDNLKSGARLTWDYFFASPIHIPVPERKPVPILVQYAQEYDLWTKQLSNTDEVQSGLRYKFPPHEANLSGLADFIFASEPHEIEKLMVTGSVIIGQEKKTAESLIRRHLQFTKFLDYENIPVCFMPAELVNIAGEMLYTKYPDAPFVVLFEDNYNFKSRKYSLRSRREGGADVSQIASRIGGKGHYNSAGATVSLDLVFEQAATHSNKEQ